MRTYERKTKPLDMLDGRRHAWKLDQHTYQVYGRSGERHEVQDANGMPLCDCTAAQYGRPCWHAALVLARLSRS